jgi:transcriptional regulator with XRE-family HTH domain
MVKREPFVAQDPVVEPAPAEQRIGKAEVSSGGRGKPLDEFVGRLEAKYPGIEEKTGLSSAALRAGRQVREMRVANGWTQVELARKLGWDQVRISNIERGEGTLGPSFDVLQKIAVVCDYDIEFKPRSGDVPIFAWEMFGRRIPHAPVSNQQFADACVAFAGLVGAEVQAHFRMVEELPAGAKFVKGEAGDIPYVELATHGKRMVMLPVLVGDSDAQADTDVDEVALTMTYLQR